jgi:hypothetical protein
MIPIPHWAEFGSPVEAFNSRPISVYQGGIFTFDRGMYDPNVPHWMLDFYGYEDDDCAGRA